MTVGSLAIDPELRCVMVVQTWDGMYGRAMVDAVQCHPDMSTDETAECWITPLAYFADELSPIIERIEP